MWTTRDEATGRIYINPCFLVEQLCRDDFSDDTRRDVLSYLLGGHLVTVLRRNDDSIDTYRGVTLILHRDLGLPVRA